MAHKGIKQTDLIDLLNLEQPAISKHFNNDSLLTLEEMQKIADHMDIQVPDLLRPPSSPERRDPYDGLSNEQIEHLARIADTFRSDGTGG